MKRNRGLLKKIKPMPAAAALFALAGSAAHAQTTPVFDYSFPASWGGTGTTVIDQSTAGDNGSTYGTVSLSSSALPPGGVGDSLVLNGGGGIVDGTTSPLLNSTVASAGGFSYMVDFMWNGGTAATQKIIDYAGTESLQLAVSGGVGSLQMTIGGDASQKPDVPDPAVVQTTIQADTWYNVTMTFNTDGNSLDGNGDITGTVDLYVNGSLVDSASATKGDYGDSLSRGIGIGMLAYRGGPYVGFDGDIYDPTVVLGVEPVPEPSALALSALGGLGFIGMMWKKPRRKA